MVDNEKNTCPYCKEEIKPEAIKCKHCNSKLGRATPSHEGVCPFCKESIKPDAIKCKHCKTSLATDSDCGCDNVNDVNRIKQAMALRIDRNDYDLRGFETGSFCSDGIRWCFNGNNTHMYICGVCGPFIEWIEWRRRYQERPKRPRPPGPEFQGHFDEYLDRKLVNRESGY